ncbi:MAG TPA: hypothetical protein VG733_17805 [Chthoniobacteraceae bacterium]|nr:hypothetical protein [Chthoniobacteraceae bacterium]
MIPLLLKILGVKLDAAQEVSSAGMQLRQQNWLGWVVFIALLLAVYTWWVYRYLGGHRDLGKWRRIILAALRFLLLLLLLFILLRPVFSFTIDTHLRRTLIVLIDKSASMNIQDSRLADNDVKRAAIGKDFIHTLDQTVPQDKVPAVQHIARTELVKAVFANPTFNIIPQLKSRYDIEYLDFNRDVKPTSEEEALNAPPPEDDSSEATAIGDAIREVINRKRGQPVTGILLVTDGANNAGSEPIDAANAARQEHMPLYIYGVGITSPRDIIVDKLFTPEVAFLKDDVQVTVRVRGQSLDGEKARLSLRLDNTEVASKDLTFSGDDDEQVVPLTFTPDKAGLFDLSAAIPARDDETVKDNNAVTQRLRVIDSKIKVLFVEQTPRWEFRFIQSALLRDRRVDAKFLLLQGDPELAGAEGSPYIAKFPTDKQELFKYDLIIIGDVDPKVFSADDMANITEFVTKFGGALTFIAGKQFDPEYYAGTPFEKLLPVEISTSAVEGPADNPTTLALTPLGMTSSMLKLAADEQQSAAIWKRFPPIHWIARVGRAKAGAQVLLEDTDLAKASRSAKMPAMALQQYGVGQVLYIGTDDTWRWREDSGVAYYPLLWGQIVQRMALAHLLGASKKTQLSVDKETYAAGERVTVYARLYNQNFAPVQEPSVNGFYTSGSGPKQSVPLRALPGQAGMYRGEFVPVTPGTYKFYVESDPQTTIDVVVTKPRFELGETAMDESSLKEMARASGGVFFREENLADLTKSISQNDEKISRVIDADMWSSPFYLAIIVIVAVLEWVLRKRSELK